MGGEGREGKGRGEEGREEKERSEGKGGEGAGKREALRHFSFYNLTTGHFCLSLPFLYFNLLLLFIYCWQIKYLI